MASQRSPKSIPAETLEIAADALKAMAHPLRLRICQALVDHGPLTVSELAEHTGATPNAISQNLKLMKVQQIVRAQRSGRNISYHAAHPMAATLIDCIRRNSRR
jgi:DNA-binding transcriptional ArsR family regulator